MSQTTKRKKNIIIYGAIMERSPYASQWLCGPNYIIPTNELRWCESNNNHNAQSNAHYDFSFMTVRIVRWVENAFFRLSVFWPKLNAHHTNRPNESAIVRMWMRVFHSTKRNSLSGLRWMSPLHQRTTIPLLVFNEPINLFINTISLSLWYNFICIQFVVYLGEQIIIQFFYIPKHLSFEQTHLFIKSMRIMNNHK